MHKNSIPVHKQNKNKLSNDQNLEETQNFIASQFLGQRASSVVATIRNVTGNEKSALEYSILERTYANSALDTDWGRVSGSLPCMQSLSTPLYRSVAGLQYLVATRLACGIVITSQKSVR